MTKAQLVERATEALTQDGVETVRRWVALAYDYGARSTAPTYKAAIFNRSSDKPILCVTIPRGGSLAEWNAIPGGEIHGVARLILIEEEIA